MTLKSCIKSMRLRTLPLSLAGIVTGIALASTQVELDVPTVILLIITACSLQILSNLSNELGDAMHGTDTADRQGIHYSIQDGEMTVGEMKLLIAVMLILSCCSGLAMIYASFGTLLAPGPVVFIFLGTAALWAAMNYTLGSHPYGYRGLGDISVFVFFGLATVLGAAYLCSHTFAPLWLLPSFAIGCWSVAVLNVNNIRDSKTDSATRTTVAIMLGEKRARIYQALLIFGGWILLLCFSFVAGGSAFSYLYILAVPGFAYHLYGVFTRTGKALDIMLPILVMSTFATALLFAAGCVIASFL